MMGEVFLAMSIVGLFVAQFSMWLDLRSLRRQLRERGLL